MSGMGQQRNLNEEYATCTAEQKADDFLEAE